LHNAAKESQHVDRYRAPVFSGSNDWTGRFQDLWSVSQEMESSSIDASCTIAECRAMIDGRR